MAGPAGQIKTNRREWRVMANTSASYTYKFEFPDDLQPENEAK